jgi:Protein of unknown function (DUF2934)
MAKPKRRRTDKIIAMPIVLPDAPSAIMTDHDIARRAYELYEQRGRDHGHDLDDWLQAERELQSAVSVAISVTDGAKSRLRKA